jgi:hypothetical protein
MKGKAMPKTTAIANGANEIERKAAEDANEVQDACNIVAIVGCWHRHLLEMSQVLTIADAKAAPALP